MERRLLTVFSFSYNICKEILCICGNNIQPIKKTNQAFVGIFFCTHIYIYLHVFFCAFREYSRLRCPHVGEVTTFLLKKSMRCC